MQDMDLKEEILDSINLGLYFPLSSFSASRIFEGKVKTSDEIVKFACTYSNMFSPVLGSNRLFLMGKACTPCLATKLAK